MCGRINRWWRGKDVVKQPIASLETPSNTLVKSLPQSLGRQFKYSKLVNFKLLSLVERRSQWPSERLHRLPSTPEWLEMESAIGKELFASLKTPSNTLVKSSPQSLGRQFEYPKYVNFGARGKRIRMAFRASPSPSQHSENVWEGLEGWSEGWRENDRCADWRQTYMILHLKYETAGSFHFRLTDRC